MPSNEKKGVTVKIDAELHAEVRQYIEAHEMTMADFVTMAFQDELHPKITMTEGKTMGNTRTIAFQVPEELFQKIKDYIQRHNMTQKDFVLGLIEDEINRDLQQREAEAPDKFEEQDEDESEDEELDENSDPDESEDEDEELDESESQGMKMGM